MVSGHASRVWPGSSGAANTCWANSAWSDKTSPYHRQGYCQTGNWFAAVEKIKGMWTSLAGQSDHMNRSFALDSSLPLTIHIPRGARWQARLLATEQSVISRIVAQKPYQTGSCDDRLSELVRASSQADEGTEVPLKYSLSLLC